jgi:hypothetical protein
MHLIYLLSLTNRTFKESSRISASYAYITNLTPKFIYIHKICTYILTYFFQSIYINDFSHINIYIYIRMYVCMYNIKESENTHMY